VAFLVFHSITILDISYKTSILSMKHFVVIQWKTKE